MIRSSVLMCASLLAAVPVNAQIIQAASPFATPGETELAKADGVANHPGSKDAQAITQGEIDASPDGTKIGIQAADLWLSKWARFYGRVTVPVTQKADTTKDSSASADAKPAALSATAKQQLVDPYGGLANLSGGLFKLLYSFEPKPNSKSPVRLSALVARRMAAMPTLRNTDVTTKAEAASKNAQGSHGIFADVRAGFKFIDLPEPGDSTPEVVGTKVNVFYAGAIGVKMIAPLYPASADDNTAPDFTHRTGGLTVGIYYVFNSAADTTQSSAYKDLLNKRTTAWTGVLGWDLPNTEVASLTFSITPKTSDARLGKTFVFGITLKNKKADKSDGGSANSPDKP